jgi:hypothetical protein
MEDVTNYFNEYRECVRHLWNTYFRSVAEQINEWDVRDEFDDIARALFASLVLHPLGVNATELTPASSAQPKALRAFRIVPRTEHGVPILINRDLPRSGYWDHPLDLVRPTDVELHLLRFFDFDQIGHRDFKYYEVLIAASETHPEIVGRAALIECEYAKVFCTEKSS